MTVLRLCLKNRPILIRLADRSDSDRVFKFLQKNFLPYIHIFQEDSVVQSEKSKEHYVECLDSGVSMLALTDNDEKELVGLSLAKKFSENESRKKLEELKNVAYDHYSSDIIRMIFAEEMKLRSKICRLYNIEEALYSSASCVRRDFQGFSVTKTILENMFITAGQLGFKVGFAITTTDEGFNLHKSLGSHAIYSQKYVEYQDHRGIFVYSTYPSEATANVVVKMLNS